MAAVPRRTVRFSAASQTPNDREFTRDVLLQQARYYESQGKHNIAEWFYNTAYAHADNDETVAIELANQYKSTGNYTKAEYRDSFTF